MYRIEGRKPKFSGSGVMRLEVVNVGEPLGVMSTSRQAGDTVCATGGKFSLPGWRRRGTIKGPVRHADPAQDTREALRWYRLAMYALHFGSVRRHHHYLVRAAQHYHLLELEERAAVKVQLRTMKTREKGRIDKALAQERKWRQAELWDRERQRATPKSSPPGPMIPRLQLIRALQEDGLIPPWPGPARRHSKNPARRAMVQRAHISRTAHYTRSGFAKLVGDERLVRTAK